MTQAPPALAAPLRPFLDWSVDCAPEEWGPVDAALIGLPYSEAYSGEPRPNDQAQAPEAIRALSSQLTYGAEFWDFSFDDSFAGLAPGGARDGGNLQPAADFDRYFDTAVQVLRRQFQTARFSVVLGGDHGVTIPAVQALEVLGRPIHLVQIDAHIDWRDAVRGARRGYSSPIRRASELPWISGITQIGIRGSGSARAGEVADARAWGARIFPASEVHDQGLGPVIAHLKGKGPFYLTVDADGLDPSVMPAVAGPVPGGLRYDQLVPILRALGAGGLVGMDMVEVAPSLDLPNRITALTAGRIVVDALAAARGKLR